jgi:DNA-binding beta-propeller fold protein YncE
MRKLLLLTAVCFPAFAATLHAQDRSETQRYLYLSTPDAAQVEGQAEGAGILIFDIDDGHKLVRRIDIPAFELGTRGLAGSLVNHSLYYSTQDPRIGAFDLETEQITWEQNYALGSDRSSITMDGEKVYVPTGWWISGEESGVLVLDADNGELIKQVRVGRQAHNSLVSVDGRFLYLGTTRMLTVLDTENEDIVYQIAPVGESGGQGVFPFTVDSANRYAYVSLGNHVGFEVVDLAQEKIIHRVLVDGEPILHRTHGAALTPDETELWISDQESRKLFIFDNTQMPPVQTGELDLSQGGHGWVTFSLDGQYAWTHTPDVFDARTKRKVATLRDENGNPVSGSKFIEVHFRDGKVVAMGNEFGLGRR